MKRLNPAERLALLIVMLFLMSNASLASEAETSASATGGWRSAGSASATAHYEGNVGFARTNTRTGRLNTARAVAVGFDRDGLSFSISTAVAPRIGPALATNLNLSIGLDGEVSSSVGQAVATGGTRRTVSAGGGVSTSTPYRSGQAISQASGKTSYGGVVRVQTRSDNTPPRQRVVPRPVWRR